MLTNVNKNSYAKYLDVRVISKTRIVKLNLYKNKSSTYRMNSLIPSQSHFLT